MTALTIHRVLGDLVRWEVERRGLYTRDSATIKNTLGASVTLTNPLGYPLKWVTDHYELCAAGEESLCAALLLEAKPIPAIANAGTSPKRYLIMIQGPAAIDRAQLPTADGVAASFTMADLYAAIEALRIRCLTEPPRSLSSDA